jgi:hypothetical protein
MGRVSSLVAVVAVAFTLGCGKSAARKFDTPEAAFKAFQEATEAADWQTAANCLTADSQTMMADDLILGVSFSTGGDEQKEKDVAALLKKHGIDLDAEPPAAKGGAGMPEISAAVKDKPALISDLMTWLKQNKDGGGTFLQLKKIGKVSVDGDKATAMVETDNGQRPIAFVRVDGGWLLSMDEDRGRGGPPRLDPDDMPDASSEAGSADGPGAEPGAGGGTLWVRDKAHELRYAVAYKTAFFDEPCTAVLLTARPLGDTALNRLKEMLAREGNDTGFFASGASLRLLFDADGRPRYLFVWADNVSINTNSGIEAQITERDGRVIGQASMKEDDTDNDNMKHRFDVNFDVALLPFAVKPIEKADTSDKEIERVPIEKTESERAEPDGAEPVRETATDSEPERIAEKPQTSSALPAIPAELPASVDATLPEPATVAEAVKLLDLSTFPIIESNETTRQRRQVGQLIYTANHGLAETFEFQRKHLKELGWEELPGADKSLQDGNPQAAYSRDGFVVSMSVSETSSMNKSQTYVAIQNHGNVATGKLPVPAGAQTHYASPRQTIYIAAAPEAETAQACRQLLLDKGWKPYGKTEKTMYFKRNAVQLSADVRSFDNQPGKTYITYSTELLSADLPLPAEADDPEYADSLKRLTFQVSGNAVEKLVAFYKDELARQGFKATTEPIGNKNVALVFRNDAKEMITLDMDLSNGLTRASLQHYSAAEMAEMDRRHKEAVAKRGKLEEEARRIGAEDLVGADLEWLEKELTRRKAIPKIVLPIPGKAKKVEQRNAENIEITVALGAGKTVVEALGKHFQAAGWREDKVELGDEDGSLRISKGEASLTFEYRDWFGADEIDVDADNAKLEPSRDVAEFAALGGVVRGAPPPAELLAKAPVDIPIPADARDVQVRSGANVAYELAGDMNTLVAYFRTSMARHGWTYEAGSSHVDNKITSLNFKKGRSPCGVSMSNVFGGDYISVTIAGGGMNWSRLRGARADADMAVAAELAAAKSKATGAKSKTPPAPASRPNTTTKKQPNVRAR